jgi:predicted RNA-binding protein YlqC (UPF0109 family)
MKQLTEFIISNIIGSQDFTIEENVDERGFTTIDVKLKPDHIGLVIGKGGNTIKMIRSLLRVKATLEKKLFSLTVSEI